MQKRCNGSVSEVISLLMTLRSCKDPNTLATLQEKFHSVIIDTDEETRQRISKQVSDQTLSKVVITTTSDPEESWIIPGTSCLHEKGIQLFRINEERACCLDCGCIYQWKTNIWIATSEKAPEEKLDEFRARATTPSKTPLFIGAW
ncbi:hypothetical protein A2V71_01685 [Candidatus Berkelbacteria bacterium RBG_13_40_8]|uniref:Uncharacterized protein n=1 Tax=Candidatus Berkelbacteria bacterium RBG_13_40_8 TaxID=1797467 RepID=A0A1F5DPN2_9BACT|nr:MAG: hypothetical protein A2V71_01685 [Candidatus Berkelbacteria bacterium RBG_13_40_8]